MYGDVTVLPAETARNQAKTQVQINDASAALNAAITAFNNAKQDGTYTGIFDLTALNAAIIQAEAAKEGIVVSVDGSDVSFADEWVTEDVMELFDAAIATATAARNNADDQDIIDAAAIALNTAITVFNNAKQAGQPLNFTELSAAIAEAQTAKAGIEISDSADYVPLTDEWVTAEVMQTFENAIAAAETAKDQATTQIEIETAVTALKTAINVFNDTKQYGTSTSHFNFTAINAAISEAQAAKEGIAVSVDGSDVPYTEKWVSSSAMNTFNSAISTAETARSSATSQEEIDAAATTLNAAIAVFNGAKQDGKLFDYDALDTAISEAQAAKVGVVTSADGNDVLPTETWVSSSVMNTFNNAIIAAETTRTNATSQEEINTAVTVLNAAIAAFNSAKQNGPPLDFTALDTAISQAQAANDGVLTSTDGSDVPKTNTWVSSGVMNVFNDAISAAQTARSSAASQAEINTAVTTLNAAITVFNSAKQPGTMIPPPTIFGVISEARIGGSTMSNQSPELRLENAYQRFTSENPNMDAVITVGDFTNSGTLGQFEAYKGIMDTYSTATHNLLAMGDRDNSDVNGTVAEERFFDVFNQQATKVTKINGYHFITISTRDDVLNTASLTNHREWLEDRLGEAHAEDPDLPIFVFQHHTIGETNLVGSGFGSAASSLHDIYSQYPQVVVFTGQSQVSFADPRSIWQGDYTAIHTGSIYQTSLDRNHHLTTLTPRAGYPDTMHNALNVTLLEPYNRGDSSSALIVEAAGTQVTVRRIDMFYNTEIASTFVFDTSVNKSLFPYREDTRIAASSAPQFAGGAQISFTPGERRFAFTFPQALNTSASIGDDGAHFYKVTVKDTASGNVLHNYNLHGSHFMFPRPGTVTFDSYGVGIVAGTNFEVIVTPVGFFGKEGTPLTGTVNTLAANSIPRLDETFDLTVQTLADMAGIDLGIMGAILNLLGMQANQILNVAYPGITVQAVFDIFGQPVLFDGGDNNSRNGTMQVPLTGSTTLRPSRPNLTTIWDPQELFSYL